MLAIGLRLLRVQNNRLSDKLPAKISMLQKLTEFAISGNKITGCIPTSIRLLLNLKSLDLSNNNISGAIPSSSIGMISSLAVLH